MSIPATGQQWMAIIAERAAQPAAARKPLRIQGGGSKAFWGRVGSWPAADLLDTRALSGITAYEPSELVITAWAGTPLAEIEAALAEKGQCLAFDPPKFSGTGTLGGVVASGLSGPARASVGAARDFVLGIQMINGMGEWLKFGGQVMKNVAGYDVSRLMCGSWGALGVITELSLKVLPTLPAEATLRFEMPSQQAALDALNRWGGQPLPLNASVWHQGVLHLRLRGAQAAVATAVAALSGERVGEEASAFWASWRDHQHAFFTAPSPQHALLRMSVPQTAPEIAASLQAVEWHGGQRWVWATQAEAQTLVKAARAAGGDATIVIATNNVNTLGDWQFGIKNAENQALQARVQQQFDPHAVFDTSRLFA
jgi:glycolate oxidase FAD binding subunit